MRATAIHSRPDQIDALTRGLQLPLRAIDSFHLEVVAERLLCAFQDIAAQSPDTALEGSEAEVTALLETRLNKLLEEDILWSQLVLNVVRGKETVSFDGSHLEKRPDLSIFLSNRTQCFPLIVEAKILDQPKGRTEALYCSNGLQRFVAGDYAWAGREAFMIAYVRDGSTIGGRLTPFLKRARRQKNLNLMVGDLPKTVCKGKHDLARSRHGRSFDYPNRTAGLSSPGPIDIWHLWLTSNADGLPAA